MEECIPEIVIGLAKGTNSLFATRYYFYLSLEQTVATMHTHTKELQYNGKDFILFTKEQFKEVLDTAPDIKIAKIGKSKHLLFKSFTNSYSSIDEKGERVYKTTIVVASTKVNEYGVLEIYWKPLSATELLKFEKHVVVSYDEFIASYENRQFNPEYLPKFISVKEKEEFF